MQIKSKKIIYATLLLIIACGVYLHANDSQQKFYIYSEQTTHLKPVFPILQNQSIIDKLNANPFAIELLNELKKYYYPSKNEPSLTHYKTIPFGKSTLPRYCHYLHSKNVATYTDKPHKQNKNATQLQSIINLEQQ
jgi:hypothetical protein